MNDESYLNLLSIVTSLIKRNLLYLDEVRRRGVVSRVPAFQPGSPGSIPGRVRNLNFNPGTGRESFVYVLPCVVSGSDLDILLTTDSERPVFGTCLMFWSRDCCFLDWHLTHGCLDCKSRGCSSYYTSERVNNR